MQYISFNLFLCLQHFNVGFKCSCFASLLPIAPVLKLFMTGCLQEILGFPVSQKGKTRLSKSNSQTLTNKCFIGHKLIISVLCFGLGHIKLMLEVAEVPRHSGAPFKFYLKTHRKL